MEISSNICVCFVNLKKSLCLILFHLNYEHENIMQPRQVSKKVPSNTSNHKIIDTSTNSPRSNPFKSLITVHARRKSQFPGSHHVIYTSRNSRTELTIHTSEFNSKSICIAILHETWAGNFDNYCSAWRI